MIFAIVALSLISISMIVTFFERVGIVYENQQSVSMLFEYIRFKLPEYINFILPVTGLSATLLVLGLLTKFNETTAMKACGISLYRMVIPIVLLALLVSLFSFYLQENIVPLSNKRAEEVWNKIRGLPPRSYRYIDRRWVMSSTTNRIYHYIYFDDKNSVFNEISILDLDLSNWSLQRWVHASKGDLRGNRLTLRDGWTRTFLGDMSVGFEKFKKKTIKNVEDKSFFLKEWKEPDQMSYRELKQYIEDIGERGFETTRFKVDLKFKISFSFACLIMTLLGIPFSFSMGKRGTLVGLGLSIVIAMVYWGAIGVFKSLGYINYLNSFFAAWGPNLIFGSLGIYLIFRLRT
jgi:LPS export ABC transporter permease LptG